MDRISQFLKENSTLIAVGAAAGVTLLGVGYYMSKRAGRTEGRKERRRARRSARPGRATATADGLSKEDLVKLFKTINGSSSRVIEQLQQMKSAIASRAAQQGEQVKEEELAQFLMSQFAVGMQQAEQAAYESFNTNEEAVKEATSRYSEDEEVKSEIEKLRNALRSLSGAPPNVEVPEHVTKDVVLNVVRETMEMTTNAMEEAVEEITTKHAISKAEFPAKFKEDEPLQRELHTLYVEKCKGVKEHVQEKYGIQNDVLQAAMSKFVQDQEFAQEMESISQKQAERLSALGLTQ